MNQAHSNPPTLETTVPGTAELLPTSMYWASRKVAIAMEQVKLIDECVKFRMGTRGVE